MNLTDILEEIKIGSLQNDEKSKKLSAYVQEVKDVLEKPNTLKENFSLSFNFAERASDISTSQSQLFYQGSYAIHTAIKHYKYDVDADIAFYINDFSDTTLRDKILNSLENSLGVKYSIEKKKPCITIDFRDGYKVDIAIYSKSILDNLMMFHNSIDGFETKTNCAPKNVVKEFSDYLKDNDVKRPIIRLIKHFSKNAGYNLGIDECNKIPSISFMLFARKNYTPRAKAPTEEVLAKELSVFTSSCLNFFEKNRKLDSPDLLIGNTLYKIQDFNQVISVLDEIQQQLDTKNYASLVSEKVYTSIEKRNNSRNNSDATPAMLGTMG